MKEPQKRVKLHLTRGPVVVGRERTGGPHRPPGSFIPKKANPAFERHSSQTGWSCR